MSFDKVLVANRGEIAVRLIRACRKLNLKSVAVYSDADEYALHVEMADEAIHLGSPEAHASYLDGSKIIDAALKLGAGAIHPGYGFLSENADFARACNEAGIVFVGPNPDAIASMGAKIEAKRIAEKAGVHCVPGYHGDDQDDATLLREAERIGTPLLIKASAGGGGRGMRRIDDLDTFTSSLSLARDEARAAFGDPSVLLEKYVEAPRHIEVQILADQHGNVRHLYERDCSVQRNYQKVIEEAPAPNLDQSLREQILDDAIRLATAIGYDNAGTVEFVVDAAHDAAYFLEMNTRLQVEHPVTEMVTGIDLAEWQLRIAMGQSIAFEQADVTINGWAIEARVAAENPAAGYRPETGTVEIYEEPSGEGIRVDSGIRAGSVISPYYDSMLAKLIMHGPDRQATIRGLGKGLTDYQIGGVGVNLAFLADVLNLEAFQSGQHLTGLLQEVYPQGWSGPGLANIDLAHAALAWHVAHENRESSSVWENLGAWRLGERIGRKGNGYYYLQHEGGEPVRFRIEGRFGTYRLWHEHEEILSVEKAAYSEGRLRYCQGGQISSLRVRPGRNQVSLQTSAGTCTIEVLPCEDILLREQSQGQAGGNTVQAPTPGLISEVLVKSGDQVEAGQPVVVLEAMKLFQQLTSPVTGVIDHVYCHAGDSVNSGEVLISLQDQEEMNKPEKESA